MFEIPAGFNLPSSVQKALKKRDELAVQLTQFQVENFDCVPQKRIGDRDTHTPILENAEAQWNREMKESIKAGKDFKSLDDYLAPFEKKASEYGVRVKAQEELIAESDKELIVAIRQVHGDLVTQAYNAANEAKAAYVKALQDAQNARAAMAGAVNRFCWTVTGGNKGKLEGVGFGSGGRDGLGIDLNVWQATTDGRITVDTMRALGLVNQWEGVLMLPEFEDMVYNPENPLAEEVSLKPSRDGGTHECPSCGLRLNAGSRRVSCIGSKDARHTRATFTSKADLDSERHPNFPRARQNRF
ncbi:hypothetical protein ACIOHC_23375 [Streptomyces sp. NPDC088252]|uniref:hypothetical protein n=1 Tax=Streptomyces sp. NPDC088252 TaxID=3365845 RepID=UPI0037F92249